MHEEYKVNRDTMYNTIAIFQIFDSFMAPIILER